MFGYEMIIRLINSFFTIGIGLLLTYMYIRKARFVSLSFWSVAFLLYGVQILYRVWRPWEDPMLLLIGTPMCLLLILGTSHIMKRDTYYVAISLTILAVLLILSPSNYLARYGGMVFFAIMTIAVVHLRLIAGKIADRFIVGWLILLIANMVFTMIFNFEWIADLVAIPAKAILGLGMLDQRFARMILDIKKIYSALPTAIRVEMQRSKE